MQCGTRTKFMPLRPGATTPWSDNRVLGRAVTRERARSGVPGGVTELLLDAQELVVLGDPVRAGRRAGLDLATADGHGQVGDRGVLRLARPVAHHRLEPGPV